VRFFAIIMTLSSRYYHHDGGVAMRHINSLTNPAIKSLRALHDRKRRRQSRRFLAEGMRIVTEAFELGWTPDVLVFRQGRADDVAVRRLISLAENSGADVMMVSEEVLAKISRKDNPQMVLASFKEDWAAAEAAFTAKDGVWVALDRVRDPGNLGTILRTIDAVGACGVLLVGECCDAFSVEVVRASMGAIFNIPMAQITEEDFIARAAAYGGVILGTALMASVDYRTPSWQGPMVLLMGNEQAGLTEGLMASATQLISLPMAGRSDSLNLAVATGVALYEFNRRRQK
jgi:TrmH family RNA methyltransferase